MVSASSTSRNCQQLFLTFSPRCPPYAEVAIYLLTNSGYTLKLGLKSDLTCSDPSLIIPKRTIDQVPGLTTVNSKSSVARFFARLASSSSSLYESRSILDQTEIDRILDLCRQKKQKDIINLIEKSKTCFILEGNTLSLADLMVWDSLKSSKSPSSSSAKVNSWISSIESTPQVKEACSLVDKVLSSVPILDSARQLISENLAPLVNMDAAQLFSMLDIPRERKNGDFCLPIPRLKIPGNPVQLAQDLASKFTTTNSIIEQCKAAGPFINFFIAKTVVRDTVLKQIHTMTTEYGYNAEGFGQSAIVEFSSPNIAKPFHVGHLRSTIIGNFVQNVLKANGWRTTSINYLGDWGKQYGLLAIGFNKYGSQEKLQQDPIRHLYEVYVKINVEAKEDPNVDDTARSYFKKMEEGNQEALALWKQFRDLSIVKYKEVYNRLNVNFDIYSGESQYSLTQMKDVLEELRDQGLLIPDSGAEIVNMESYGLGTAVIAKSDGSMLYLSRDIAAAIHRQEEYAFDKMFYIVGNQQDHHFKQLFKIIDLMGKPWADKCTHINFGMIKSKSGQMSTRKGTVVFLEDMLDSCKEEVHKLMQENTEKYAQIENPELVSDLVGMSAIIIQDMSARRHKDYEFDWARMVSFQGDTGPYLQYAHARLCSVERTFGGSVNISKVDLSLLNEPEAHSLIETLASYPDLVKEVSKGFEPNNVVTYMFDLCHRVSLCYETLWVKGQDKPIAEARLALYIAARLTLSNALRLVGLRPLERM